MDGNALEVALGLIRHPANRASLRVRPLPEGVGELIELAAGVPERVAEASMLCGEPPHQVREAARFYVREVLLFGGADAYRMLGVPETASAAQIKLHYRRLQHWLHPDRRGNDWESAYAIRINQAWGELRSPGRRAAYDARRERSRAVSDEIVANPFVVDAWRPLLWHPAPRRSWILPAAAVAACLAFALLVAVWEEAPPPPGAIQGKRAAEAEGQTIAATAKAAFGSMRKRMLDELARLEPAAALPSMTVAQQPAGHSAHGSSPEATVPQLLERAPPVSLNSKGTRPAKNPSRARAVDPKTDPAEASN